MKCLLNGNKESQISVCDTERNISPLTEMGVVIVRTTLNRKMDPSILKKFVMSGRAFDGGRNLSHWKYGAVIPISSH